jgi:hypothetical protein
VLRTRPGRRPNRGAEQYGRLRTRVFATLGIATPADYSPPDRDAGTGGGAKRAESLA